MSLLFNMQLRVVIAVLPRSKRVFIFMAVVTIYTDLGSPKDKVSQCGNSVSPANCDATDLTGAMIFVF